MFAFRIAYRTNSTSVSGLRARKIWSDRESLD